MSELLAAGADVDARTDDGQTALFRASNVAAVKALAAGGADVNAKDDNGDTALMGCFDVEVAKALLDAGADPSIRNNDGLNAAEESRKWREPEVAAVIEEFVSKRQGK